MQPVSSWVRAVLIAGLCLVLLVESVSSAGAVVLTDATVEITAVTSDRTDRDGAATLRADDPVVVAGVTNLDPDERLIVVTLETVDGDVVAVADVSTWGRDGRWIADLGPVRAGPGEYVVEADAADTTDLVRLTVTEPTPTPTETDTPTPTATSTVAAAPSPTTTPAPTPRVTSSPPATASTTGRGAGLTGLAVLAAVLGASAVLVARRRAE